MPTPINLSAMLQSPSWGGPWLGTDDLGRDILARVLEGLSISLTVAAGVLAITAALGIGLGWLAATHAGGPRGWLDAAISKLADVVLSFPGLLVALALVALVGPGVGVMIVAIGLFGWVGFMRLTRVQLLSLKNRPFVLAATLAGVGPGRLLMRHYLPNLAPVLLVEAVLVASGAMVAEAGLSFLGLGIPAPAASLGGMLRDGARVLMIAPHAALVPALVLIGITVALNVLAEALRRRLPGR